MVGREDIELMAHLMRRAGFGATRDELEEYAANGYGATVEELLHPRNPRHMQDDVIRRYHVDIHESRVHEAPATEWVYRMVTTKCPLEEKIALFWHGILATGFSKTQQSRSLAVQIGHVPANWPGKIRCSPAGSFQGPNHDHLVR